MEHSTAPDRYEEGYADGFAAGQPLPSSNGQLPLDGKDMLWLIKLPTRTCTAATFARRVSRSG